MVNAVTHVAKILIVIRPTTFGVTMVVVRIKRTMEKPAEATANVPAVIAWTECAARPLVMRDVSRVAKCTLGLAMVLVET